MTTSSQSRETFSGRKAFIFAAIGSAVGLEISGVFLM
ncbi:neurotransmitter symporter [Pasteurella canis]|nr:neurotransmitter symporter [Pasteurella canis]